jgi:hypothetical protein
MSQLERLRKKTEKLKENRDLQLEKEQKITTLRSDLRQLHANIYKLKRSGRLNTREVLSAQKKQEKLESQLATNISQLNQIKTNLRQLDFEFSSASSLRSAIRLFSDRIPILLFPIRLETKFVKDERQLLVRIYPDDIVVETHEPNLTEEELEASHQYYRQLWRAGKDRSNVETEKRWKDAWRQLVETQGTYRAAYIAQQVESNFIINGADNIENWNVRPDDPVGDDDDAPEPVIIKDLPMRPSPWSQSPRTYVMPDRFVVLLYRNGSIVHEELGNSIPHPLIVGPTPYPTEEMPEERLFDADSEWIVDFDKAVKCGMALKIDLTEEDLNEGFSRVVAIGVKASAGIDDSIRYLEGLIESHHYTEGFSFISQWTPTNNASTSKSGFTSQEPTHEGSYKVELENPLIRENDTNKDGYRVAHALGISRALFEHIENSNKTENEDAKRMLKALWPVTWDYFIKRMMANKNLTQEALNAMYNHYIEYVRGRGPLPAIRVGNMPYGLLPTTAYSNWEPNSFDSKWIEQNQRESDYKFNIGLGKIVHYLYTMWREMSEDKQAVPRVGGSDDPDKELVEILGMEGGSHTCHIRPVVTELYLWNLMRFLSPNFFSAGWPWISISQTSANCVQTWWEEYEKTKEESKKILEDLGLHDALPPILRITPWGPGYDLDKPLVEKPPLSEYNRLRCIGMDDELGPIVGDEFDGDYMNYIGWLIESSLDDIRNVDSAHPSDSLLYNLLRRVILLEGSKDQIEDDFNYLSGLATANLERLLMETLDLCTHRLDAWITSLVTKRLDCMRRDKDKGIYLGAFGWVEDLKPAENNNKCGGYIHCPSISQADTAAVLRSAYLTHAEKENAYLMSVNLTSERVRRSLWLLDGMRQGQPLGALLGYLFERGLHENYPHLDLDKYIYVFRSLYPLKAGKEIELKEGEAVEAVAASNVVHGLNLLNAWKEDAVSFYPRNGLPHEGEDEYKAIITELHSLDNTFDSLADLGLAESVYQCVQGNYDRAGAILEAIETGSQVRRPPEAEFVSTPRSGINLKHRLAVLFTHPPPDLEGWSPTVRGKAEPHLDAWAGMMLGHPGTIKCKVFYPSEPASGSEPDELYEEVSVEDLKIGPLDFLYLSSSPAKGEATEIEQLLAYFIRKEKNLKRDAKIRIEFKLGEDSQDQDKSFAEVLVLAERMNKLIANASFLEPTDLFLPEEEEAEEVTGFKIDDYDKFEERVDAVHSDFSKAYENLPTAITDCNFANIRKKLLEISQFGLRGAIPDSAIDTDQTVLKDLSDRANSILSEIENREKKYSEFMNKAEERQKAGAVREGINYLVEAMQSLLGRSFKVLPRFTPANSEELKKVLDATNTTNLLNGENPLWPILWLQQVAQTHPRVNKFETVMMLGEALTENVQLQLRIGQLPFKEDDRWLALPFKDDEKEKQQGTLSIVAYTPNVFHPDGEYAGLVLDEWDEIIPSDTETTAIAYQFNQPSAEPPQTLLLSVSSKLKEEESTWEWDDLLQSVSETLEFAKVRAVDLDALRKVGRFLPALYMPTKVDE